MELDLYMQMQPTFNSGLDSISEYIPPLGSVLAPIKFSSHHLLVIPESRCLPQYENYCYKHNSS